MLDGVGGRSRFDLPCRLNPTLGVPLPSVLSGVMDLDVLRVGSLAVVADRETRPSPSPSLISDSIARSRLPFTPLSTIVFLCWSPKPMSRSRASLIVVSLSSSKFTLAPISCDGLLEPCDDGRRTSNAGRALSFFERDVNGNRDDADLSPNLDEFLGGSGGGMPSSERGL